MKNGLEKSGYFSEQQNAMAAQTEIFLGIDLSTQSVKATVIDSSAKVIQEILVNFEADLPHYKTQGRYYKIL